MPWNSVRYNVSESATLQSQRIMAFRTPAESGQGGPLHADTPPNRWGVFLTNRYTVHNFTFVLNFDDDADHVLQGHRYAPNVIDVSAGSVKVPRGASVNITLLPQTVEVWLEY